jgi:hypothetical protein
VNSGERSSAGRIDPRVDRRQDGERRQQRRDEGPHRAFLRRQLDVEVGEPQQPDERGDRRRRADQRRVARLHRLHADQEGVGEQRAAEDRRRGGAGARVAAREVRDVDDGGGRVEDERDPGGDRHEPVGP